MAEVEFKDRIEVVYKAIEDATNTIRFLDTKVAATFIIIGIITSTVVGYSGRIGEVYKFFSDKPVHASVIGLSILAYFISIIVAIIYGFKAIKAADNPNNHVNNDGYQGKNLWHLLSKSDGKISISVEEYLLALQDLEEDDFIRMVSIELMKVSAIRNIKIQNVNNSIKWFKVSLISILVTGAYLLLHSSIY